METVSCIDAACIGVCATLSQLFHCSCEKAAILLVTKCGDGVIELPLLQIKFILAAVVTPRILVT